MPDLEQRKNIRLKAEWPFWISSARRKITGRTANISEAGVLINADKPLGIEKKYQIVIFIPKRQNLKLHCEVLWSDLYGIGPENGVYGMGLCGLCFVEISEKDRHHLCNLVSFLKKGK